MVSRVIRDETPAYVGGVRRVLERAFETSAEADLVEQIRADQAATVACVALDRDEHAETETIVGQILFSPLTLQQAPTALAAVGLGPMAVTPERQRRGIGSALVESGLARCRDLGVGVVVVLGHPNFYPRFGFRPAHLFGLHSEYDVPPELFMAMELASGALDGCGGLVRYHPAFATV